MKLTRRLNKMPLSIPEKCKPCIHRINDYCRGYQAKIEILSVDGCKRKKVPKWRRVSKTLGFAGNNSNYMG